MSKKLVKCKTCGTEIAKSAKTCPRCGGKIKKRFSALRVVLGTLLIFVGLGLFSQAFSGESSPSDKPVTMDKFNVVQSGMTYAEVVDIMGFEGELGSQVDIGAGSEYKTETYTWSNRTGSNMNATFQGGKLMPKAQFGLG